MPLVVPPPDDPLIHGADLTVGVAYLALAVLARRRSTALAVLCAAVAITWWLGSLGPPATFWHRGPLVHLLLTFPAVRPSTAWGRVAVVAGYVVSLFPVVWGVDLLAVLLAVCLALARVLRSRPPGDRRGSLRSPAGLATTLVATGVVTDVVARTLVPLGAGVRPSFVFFSLCLVVGAGALAWGLRPSDPERLTDLVVQMGMEGGQDLRSQLAEALGDPALQLAVEREGSFVDEGGAVVTVPSGADPRRGVIVRRPGAPAVLVIHHASPQDEPALREAVDRWVAMSAANAGLRDRTRLSIEQVVLSRRRLLVAADEERDRLAERMEGSVTRPLRTLRAGLAAEQPADTLLGRFDAVIGRLEGAGRGLTPPGLGQGIAPALSLLVPHVPLAVRLDVTTQRVDPASERAAFYVCAEALTNAVKHAGATLVEVRVVVEVPNLLVEVSDDGGGGAVPVPGSGLAGLADRVGALGGRLEVESSSGAGTTLRARLPV